MKLRTLAVIAIGLVLIVGSGGGGSGTTYGLPGSWVFAKVDMTSPYTGTITFTSAMGITGTITFNENGTFTASGNYYTDSGSINGTWSASGSTLTLTAEGDTQSVSYSISGSVLTMSASEEGVSYIAEFNRA